MLQPNDTFFNTRDKCSKEQKSGNTIVLQAERIDCRVDKLFVMANSRIARQRCISVLLCCTHMWEQDLNQLKGQETAPPSGWYYNTPVGVSSSCILSPMPVTAGWLWETSIRMRSTSTSFDFWVWNLYILGTSKAISATTSALWYPQSSWMVLSRNVLVERLWKEYTDCRASRVAVRRNCKSIPALSFLVPKGGLVRTVLITKEEEAKARH